MPTRDRRRKRRRPHRPPSTSCCACSRSTRGGSSPSRRCCAGSGPSAVTPTRTWYGFFVQEPPPQAGRQRGRTRLPVQRARRRLPHGEAGGPITARRSSFALSVGRRGCRRRSFAFASVACAGPAAPSWLGRRDRAVRPVAAGGGLRGASFGRSGPLAVQRVPAGVPGGVPNAILRAVSAPR